MVKKELEINVDLGQAAKQLEFLNKELEEAKNLTDDWEKELFQLEKQLKAVPKNNLAQQKKLRDEITKQKDLIKEQKFAVKDLTKQRQKANEVVKNATKNEADYSGVTSLADKATGGLFSKLGALTKGLKGAITGFKGLRIAIISSGIGALVLGVVSLIQAFKRSEEGQKKFKKLMGVIGAVVNQVLDLVADLGEKIIEIFSNPKQALIDFKDALQQNVINRINASVKLFGFLGSAIKKVFSGDFSGALDEAKKAGSAFVDTFTGVENTVGKATEAVKDFAKETAEEASKAADIADKRAKADILERKLIVDRAKANREINKLREQAEDIEKFSAKERLEFIRQAAKLDEEITNAEIKNARLRATAKAEENALGKSTTEDKKEQAILEAELIGLETRQLRKKRALTARETSLIREQAAEEKKIATERINLLKQIAEAEANTIDEKRELQLQKEQERYDALIAQADANNLNTDELELSREERLKEMRDKFAQEDIDRAKKVADEKEAAEKKALDAQIKAIKSEEANRQAQISMVGNAINNIGKIFSAFGKESKALAIAGIVTEQVSAVSKIISNLAVANLKAVSITPGTFGQPFVGINTALAGLSIAGSIAGASKAIADLKSNKKSASTGGSSLPSRSGGGTSAVESAPPAFNIVGQSDTNQLAEAVAGQEQQPIQAYVVSNDVTSAQSMDRNIVENASI